MGLLKRSFNKASLKQKLTTIIMLISLFVLLLASGAFITSKVFSYRQSMVNRLTTTAGIIGTNAQPAIILRKHLIVTQILGSLANEPGIVSAYIFSAEGEPIAHYLGRHNVGKAATGTLNINREDVANVLKNRKTIYSFDRHRLVLFSPIINLNDLNGVVVLHSDLSELYQFIYQFIATTFVVLLLLALIAFLLSSWMQTIISRPIRELAGIIADVSINKNFSIRAKQTTEDEVGELIQGFNSMLGQIETRDEQLETYRHNLEDTVLQRTTELQATNLELQQAIKELKKAKQTAELANQAKSQFLAKISHEIRTPMIGIMGMAEQLTDAALPESERRMALTVHKSGETLLSILNDVLDFSKIESGKLKLEEIPFSLQDVCEDVIAIFADQAHEKGLDLVFHVNADCRGPFIGDPLRIKQILLNLISNAVKFTAEGKVQLTANCNIDDGNIHLTVTDTGIGIPEKVHGKVFESFAQADDSMARNFGGSGLGLSIVRQLTQLMGGRCNLQSAPGQGSTFQIDLKLQSTKISIAPEQGSQIATTCAKAKRPGRDHHILLVEDNLTTQQLLKLILDKAGYSFDIQSNGILAIEALASSSYDLILMDCEMPDMDGLEATILIRKTDKTTPIIALTAHVRTEELDRCLQAGMNDCLNKPFRQQQLLDILDKWLPTVAGVNRAS